MFRVGQESDHTVIKRLVILKKKKTSQLKYLSLRIFPILGTSTYRLKILSASLFSYRIQIFEVRILLRILKGFMTERPEFLSQAIDCFP
jgi:hypothetical protein